MRPLHLPLVAAIGLAAAVAALPARADIYVVVNAANPQQTLTQKEVADLFTGRRRNFRNGDFALAFNLPRDGDAHAEFYLGLTGMSPAQINSYWSRLMFTGQTMPPQSLPGEEAMADIVRRNPSAIGYLTQPPTDKRLRIALVLKDGP